MVSKAKIETTKPFMGGVWIVSGATQSNNMWVTISRSSRVRAPDRTNTQSLKITEENMLPLQ